MRATFTSVRFKLTVVALAALALTWPSMAPRLRAQATTTQTTLSAAVSATADRVVVASATGISANRILLIDSEAMVVTSITGTTAIVRRGTNGTFAAAHASSAVVLAGPTNYFLQSAPASGTCTATNFIALPAAVLPSGSVFDCLNSRIVRYRLNGVADFTPGATQTYTAAGAITVQPGLQLVGSGGALAMTLAAPTALQEGMTISIVASTAQAHTITNTAGFNGGTTARDVCTLGGAIGDGITVQASGLTWYVIQNRNCTLG